MLLQLRLILLGPYRAPVCAYLKCVHFSVIKEHEDGHLEGGHLQNVLAGVKTCHLSTSHTHFRIVLLQTIRWTIAHEETAFKIPNHLFIIIRAVIYSQRRLTGSNRILHLPF